MEKEVVESIDDFKEFANQLFVKAIEMNASDIHVEPQKGCINIRLRIDGDLYHMYEISNDNKGNLLLLIKMLAKLKIDESRLPQDGQIVFANGDEDVDMRVSTFPTLYGEKIVVRILKKDQQLLNINSLGFLEMNLKQIKSSLALPEGLILVSGPTGSGKTTSLYAMLNYFDPKKYNISTLEDPIEYKLNGINQSQVKPEIGYVFSNGLRCILRQDPNIILVGEIRDMETAKLAVEASLTGHLVLGTIHSNKGMGAIERLINLGIQPYLISSALKLVVAQRLVKKNCSCGKKVEIDPKMEEILKEGLGDIWNSVKNNSNAKELVGCDKCIKSGFSGRIGIHEVICIDNDFSVLINKGINKPEWDDLMDAKGHLDIYQDGLIKTVFGITQLNQILPYKE